MISCPPDPLPCLKLIIDAHLCLACQTLELLKRALDGAGIAAVPVIGIGVLEAEIFK